MFSPSDRQWEQMALPCALLAHLWALRRMALALLLPQVSSVLPLPCSHSGAVLWGCSSWEGVLSRCYLLCCCLHAGKWICLIFNWIHCSVDNNWLFSLKLRNLQVSELCEYRQLFKSQVCRYWKVKLDFMILIFFWHLFLLWQLWRCSLWASISPTSAHLCLPDTSGKQGIWCALQTGRGKRAVLQGIWAELAMDSHGSRVWWEVLANQASVLCWGQWELLSGFPYESSAVCRD